MVKFATWLKHSWKVARIWSLVPLYSCMLSVLNYVQYSYFTLKKDKSWMPKEINRIYDFFSFSVKSTFIVAESACIFTFMVSDVSQFYSLYIWPKYVYWSEQNYELKCFHTEVAAELFISHLYFKGGCVVNPVLFVICHWCKHSIRRSNLLNGFCAIIPTHTF